MSHSTSSNAPMMMAPAHNCAHRGPGVLSGIRGGESSPQSSFHLRTDSPVATVAFAILHIDAAKHERKFRMRRL